MQRWVRKRLPVPAILGLILTFGSGAALAQKMYWTDPGIDTIQRANFDGSDVESLFAKVLAPDGVAIDHGAGKIYWSDPDAYGILRANLDGSQIEVVVSVSIPPRGTVALDTIGGRLYWSTSTGVFSVNLDGSGQERFDIFPICPNQGLAVDTVAGKVYWSSCLGVSSTGTIRRSNLDGTGVEDLVVIDPEPAAIALDVGAGKMYWTDVFGQTIHRANLDGSGKM